MTGDRPPSPNSFVSSLPSAERAALCDLAAHDRAGFANALKSAGFTKLGHRLVVEMKLRQPPDPPIIAPTFAAASAGPSQVAAPVPSTPDAALRPSRQAIWR